MKTKTEKLTEMIKNKNWNEAFALAKTFRIWDIKKDKEIVTIAHEMNHSEKFYASMGYNKNSIQKQAQDILRDIYL